ncbi:MAG: hypothetical protein WBD40_00635, partial [Tepidisphaeraceae bacterium]
MSVPLLLAYDDLPPGSDIRREHHGDLVTITIPAGDPPTSSRRALAQAAMASGAVSSWAFLLLALLVFGYFVRMNRISGPPLTWAVAFFAIFCTAIVLLVAWVRYGLMLEDLQAGRRQATVMAITPDRLVIETSGPFGLAGYAWGREQIVRVSLGRDVLRDDQGRGRRLERLAVQIAGGKRVAMLPGRDRAELRWVARAIG